MIWYTEQEAAEYLKISLKTLKWQRYRGKVAYCKIGEVVQYRVKDLDELRERSMKGESWQGTSKDSNSSNTNGRHIGTSRAAVSDESARIRQIARKLRNSEPALSLSLIKGKQKQSPLATH